MLSSKTRPLIIEAVGKPKLITHIFISFPIHGYEDDVIQEVAICDQRGRITLGKEVTQKFGRKFHVVVMPREVVLIPVPKDPLKDLREMGKKIPKHLTLRDLKRIAEEEAMKEAWGNWERLQKLSQMIQNEPRLTYIGKPYTSEIYRSREKLSWTQLVSQVRGTYGESMLTINIQGEITDESIRGKPREG